MLNLYLNLENKFGIISLILLFVLLFMMQYQIWFSNGGLPQSYMLKNKIESQLLLNQTKQKLNQELYFRIQAFDSSHSGVVGQARYDLGMIKKGEEYFQFN